ncbi:hypothetical protein [Leptobacterium sp. I13]|uniref:hypothetical protein n=1 Tax=Leptobacterium meishanense TaxID=3128904 RepID=UPI0030EC7106
MITIKQKKQIKKILGGHYVAAIKEELKLANILNKNGEEHSSTMIINVMNGKHHDIIEEAIFSAVERKLKNLELREEILTKKSVAATTDS